MLSANRLSDESGEMLFTLVSEGTIKKSDLDSMDGKQQCHASYQLHSKTSTQCDAMSDSRLMQ